MTQPVSLIIPTRNRAEVLGRTLQSLLSQSVLPAELLVVDASDGNDTCELLQATAKQTAGKLEIVWKRAAQQGAAVQRNQAFRLATQPTIGFCDDDILFETDCVERLWKAFDSSPKIGGASAMITNQRYQTPGRLSRTVFRLLGGPASSWAGRVLGPAVNLLPEDSDTLPEIVPVEWLNLGCTFYRREALPDPPFSSHFTGYSMMEDLTLSATVGRDWELVNARTARIFHDSQPGSHKSDPAALSAMELVNRWYVMTRVLNHRGSRHVAGLFLWEMFQLLATLRAGGPSAAMAFIQGKLRALPQLFSISAQH